MKPMEVGVLSSPRQGEGNTFEMIAKYGVRTTQLCNWNAALWTREYAAKIRQDSKDSGVELAAVWAGYSGPAVWNFIDGPVTLGLVPPVYREQRVAELKKGADFAAWAGAPAIITHCGFIPENPKDPLYEGTLAAIVEVGRHCAANGVGFWFETGQETPVVLLRVIEDSGLKNLGINLDTANLILYGKANPLDALDVFGAHVRNLHAKDGLYPTNGRELGHEVAIGKGKVGFPKVIRRLHELGFTGQIVIEREISGPQQAKDIQKSVGYLRRLVAKAQG
ncbi:MAG: Xylose isomerase-like TIM barrel [Lentisphaerae bacterium ADurb.BinA184]|nr:MAG: Xylose isomerase-like TIM barrel [Lentisphaerae bacterium ADurb.BinA184]